MATFSTFTSVAPAVGSPRLTKYGQRALSYLLESRKVPSDDTEEGGEKAAAQPKPLGNLFPLFSHPAASSFKDQVP